ncbi:MAG: Fe2+-dependent dioxygenase [Kofleriaceae bacterium]
MILTIANVIDPAEHAALLEIARATKFVDGRETAGPRLAETKYNTQLSRQSASLTEVANLVGAALQRNAQFAAATIPRHMHSLRLARYQAGSRYGTHIDGALMQDASLFARADLSFTLFLSEPDAYDGGELSIETGAGDMRFKLPARCLVCYATGQLHQVLEVTRGERLVVVGWVQSYVRTAEDRTTLWDLAQAIELVHAQTGKSRALDLLVKSHSNLMRRWAEP